MKPVTLKISWTDLFPRDADAAILRQRWAQWLRLARRKPDPDAARYWTDASECLGCIHKRGGWCTLQELPCTVNPVLTMRYAMIGMACMGAGYTSK